MPSPSEIVGTLDALEREKGVTILYACESGSRAWGMESQDSDFDVRFIYVEPMDYYVTTRDRRDTIERPGEILDVAGWELRKALILLRKTNPPMLEWLQSPVVYVDRFRTQEILRAIVDKYASGAACIYHYHHMAKGNFREYLKTHMVRMKKYLYVLRPLLAVRWIRQGRGVPVPMRIEDLLPTLDEHPRVCEAMLDLLDRKRNGEELGEAPSVPVLTEFIARELDKTTADMKQKGWMESYVKSKVPHAVLDSILRTSIRSGELFRQKEDMA